MHEIRMGLSFRQRLPYLAGGGALTVLGVVSIVYDGVPTSLVPGVVMLATFFASAWWGAVLTPHGLTAKGFTTRHFAWAEIAHVEVAPFLGTQTVRLTLANGKRTRLRAPIDSWGARDPEFPAKATAIWQWWAAATGRTAPPGGPAPQPWPQQGMPQQAWPQHPAMPPHPGMPQQPMPQQQWPGQQGWPQAPAGQPPYGPPGP